MNKYGTQTPPFRWCFIGTGKLAHQVAEELSQSNLHQIVSAYSRRMESTQEFTKKFGGAAASTSLEAMTAYGADGVYVVTPHNAHYLYVKEAIEAGFPVLCEKPFTTDAEQTKELFSLAEKKGVYLAEAMWTWFSPVAHQVKKWLENDEFGEIQRVKANYHMDVRRYAARLTDPNRAGGALLDIGVYPITYLYRLFGKPTEIVCTGKLQNGIDLKEDVDLRFPGGSTYRASISMTDLKGLEKFSIVGSKGKISIPWFHMAKQVKLKRKDGVSEVFSGDGSYLNEFDLVAGEIRLGKKESDYVPRQATMDVMEIMDECRRQMGLVYPFEK